MLRSDEANLYRQHHPALQRMVRAAARVPESTVQNTCAFAWLQLLRHQPDRGGALARLRTVAIRQAWHLDRLERRTTPLELVGDPDEPMSSSTLDDTVAARGALREVAALPEPQRRCLELKLAGHSYDETSGATGRTYTNVSKQLVRARRHLRLVDPVDRDASAGHATRAAPAPLGRSRPGTADEPHKLDEHTLAPIVGDASALTRSEWPRRRPAALQVSVATHARRSTVPTPG